MANKTSPDTFSFFFTTILKISVLIDGHAITVLPRTFSLSRYRFNSWRTSHGDFSHLFLVPVHFLHWSGTSSSTSTSSMAHVFQQAKSYGIPRQRLMPSRLAFQFFKGVFTGFSYRHKGIFFLFGMHSVVMMAAV